MANGASEFIEFLQQLNLADYYIIMTPHVLHINNSAVARSIVYI